MENNRIAVLLVQNIPAPFLVEHSKDFPEVNAVIKEGNTTRLLRRKDSDFLASILGLSRVIEAKGATAKQTNLEDLYYNININGDYKNLFKGMNPFILTNDSEASELMKKYKITHKVDPMDLPVSSKLLEAPETKSHRPIILHINCENLPSESKPSTALTILTDALKSLSPNYRLYLILYPFKISLEGIIPAAPSPYLQMVTPPQTYWFYKSDRVTDVETSEAAMVVESNGDNCREDELDSLADLAANKKRPGGLWMLAEQFMRQIAFYLGYIGKFGA